MNFKALIIYEDQDTLEYLEAALGPTCDVHVALTLRDADERLKQSKFDLVLIDIEMNDQSTLGFAENIRRRPSRPVVIVTSAKDTLDNRIASLQAADEFLPLTLSSEELRLRFFSCLRAESKFRKHLSFLRLNHERQSAVVRDLNDMQMEMSFTRIEFRILSYLVSATPAVVTRNDIKLAVWGAEVTSSRTLEVHLCTLRKKFAGTRVKIESAYGVGYYLMENMIDHSSEAA